MKKFVFLSVFLFLISCQNNQKSQTQHITAQQMLEAIEVESVQLIDVRTQSEFKDGFIKNAKNTCIINDDFKSHAELLDRGKPVYLYCKSGARSAKAAEILEEMGFEFIYDMSGGIDEWNENNFDLDT